MSEITRVVTPYGECDPLEREGEIRETLRSWEASPDTTEATHGAQRDRLIGEYTEIRRAVRSAQIARGTALMADESNLERPGGGQPGAPAYVRGKLGTRIETAAETIQRAGNPWRDNAGPLDRETSAGFVSRAHSAVEAVSERLGHDGAELLAT